NAVHAGLIGFAGSSATFSPLLADTSLWWHRRRGMAVAVCASGNYLVGAVWPPIVQHFVESHGWRATYVGMGVAVGVALALLALFMRRRPPLVRPGASGAIAEDSLPFGLTPRVGLGLLMLAGLSCCVAMSMPQVHIVAYCADLGYGPARGAQMLSLMLGFGIVSRVATGWIADRVGGVTTLLLGSTLQGVALVVYLIADGLTSLYLA